MKKLTMLVLASVMLCSIQGLSAILDHSEWTAMTAVVKGFDEINSRAFKDYLHGHGSYRGWGYSTKKRVLDDIARIASYVGATGGMKPEAYKALGDVLASQYTEVERGLNGEEAAKHLDALRRQKDFAATVRNLRKIYFGKILPAFSLFIVGSFALDNLIARKMHPKKPVIITQNGGKQKLLLTGSVVLAFICMYGLYQQWQASGGEGTGGGTTNT